MRLFIFSVISLFLCNCGDEEKSSTSGTQVCRLEDPNLTVKFDPKDITVNVQTDLSSENISVPVDPPKLNRGIIQFIGISEEKSSGSSILVMNRMCRDVFLSYPNARMCTDREIVDTLTWPRLPGSLGRAWVRPTIVSVVPTGNNNFMLFTETGMTFQANFTGIQELPRNELAPSRLPWALLLEWDDGGFRDFSFPLYRSALAAKPLPIACCAMVENSEIR